jgi:N-acylglucosamine-6-phosphate 2-epimerase
LGADAISTTLSGYTPYSPQLSGPDVELVAALSRDLDIPVFAEGRINEPADIQRVMAAGAYAPIVGSAITRPQLITAKFAQALSV